MSALMSGFLQTWFFVASFIPWFLIDRIGRRPLVCILLARDGEAASPPTRVYADAEQFLSMISLMAAVMAVQAALVYQVDNRTAVSQGAGIGATVMLFIFQGAFTVGFQATVWVYP